MKITYRIPTEMYAYIEIEEESGEVGTISEATPSKIKERYDELSEAFKPKPVNELEEKAFREFLINVAKGGGNTPEDLEKLSPQQRQISKYVHLVVSKVYPFKQTK